MKGIALALAKNGAKVVVANRSLDNAFSVAEEIKKYGVECLPIKTDVTINEDIKKCISTALERFGRIDIWVNNAGITQEKPLEDITPEDWDAVLDIDLKSVFFCSKEVYEVMKMQKTGKIINISSITGERGGRIGGMHYFSAKGAIQSLTKSFALQAADYNINVNAIAPGPIHTEMAERIGLTKKDFGIPLGRLGTPEDVGNAAVFLASELSDYITGSTIDVNGGLYMK
jgi:NAD(P)-dependent dehydrogenase (short-subunit alcohol dehydrogenase family)